MFIEIVCLVVRFRENAPDVLPQQRRKAYLHAEGNLRIKFRFGCEGLAIVYFFFTFSRPRSHVQEGSSIYLA